MDKPVPGVGGRRVGGAQIVVGLVGGDVGAAGDEREGGIGTGESAASWATTSSARSVRGAPAITVVAGEVFADELPVLLLHERIDAPERAVDMDTGHRSLGAGRVLAHDAEVKRLAHDRLVSGGVVQVERAVAHEIGGGIRPVELHVDRLLVAAHGEGRVALVAHARARVRRAVIERDERAIDIRSGGARRGEQGSPVRLREGEADRAKERRIVKPRRLQRAIELLRPGRRADGARGRIGASGDDGREAGDIVPRREIGGELDEPVVVRIVFDAEERAGSLTAKLDFSRAGVEQKDQAKERGEAKEPSVHSTP